MPHLKKLIELCNHDSILNIRDPDITERQISKLKGGFPCELL